MFILFAVTAAGVSILNQFNLRDIYEDHFTERALLSNSLIATMINSEDVKEYVELLRNGDEAFKNRQIQFYNDREELISLQENGAPEEEQAVLLDRMKSFHHEMSALKSDVYWEVVESLRRLRDLSHSKFVYVLADTGVTTDDGTILFTFIFDADDDGEYDRRLFVKELALL